MEKIILITGGAGFIGHHVAEHILKNTKHHVVLIDKLSYVSPGWERVRDIEIYFDAVAEGRLKLVSGDFTNPIEPGLAQELGPVTHILHLGALSHVDTAIREPMRAIHDNVIGTENMLKYAKSLPSLELFLYFSTDEVFGPAAPGVNFKEGDRFNPTNTYAATKGAAELLCQDAANTMKLPVVITNTMNVFGERQHPEKFIPKIIRQICNGDELTIHGDAKGNSGSRYWIHARNVAAALLFILERGERLTSIDPTLGRYNIVGEKEITTLDLARMVSKELGMDFNYTIVDAVAERPGHDFRYALDGGKLATLGWKYPVSLEQSLSKTIAWMIDPKHSNWLEI